MPTASTPSCATQAPRSQARARADAARPHRRGERHQGRESQAGRGSAWVLRGDRGITYAPAMPAGSRLVAGEWWPADYSGPPLVSLENRTADGPRPQDRRYRHRQRARPQHDGPHRQSARRRLAKPRHQFRPGVLARRLRRRAAYRYRDADLCRRRHDGARKRARSRRWPTLSRRSPPCASRTRSMRSTTSSATWCWRCAAPARSRSSPRPWCLAARWPPASASASMTRWC